MAGLHIIEGEAADFAQNRGSDMVEIRVDPHGRPVESKRSPAWAVHASTRRQRIQWRAAYRAFVESYRRAVQALLAEIDGLGFPTEGCRPTCTALARDG